MNVSVDAKSLVNDSDELGRLCEVKYVVRQLICVADYTNIHVESVELPFLSKKLRVDGEPKSVLNQKMRALRVENKERALSFSLASNEEERGRG